MRSKAQALSVGLTEGSKSTLRWSNEFDVATCSVVFAWDSVDFRVVNERSKRSAHRPRGLQTEAGFQAARARVTRGKRSTPCVPRFFDNSITPLFLA